MADASKIEWTDATFNPWRGCTKVSAGCAHCYAETLSGRNPKTLGVWGPNGTRVVASEAMWREPAKWNRLAGEGRLPDGSPNVDGHRPRVFCASLADVFEDWTGDMRDAAGRKLWATGVRPAWIASHNGDASPNPDVRPLTMGDVRRRLFELIDATPNLDWLLVTKRPENVERMTPVYGDESRMTDETGSLHQPRPNVWLGTSVENQAAADERIPHLLRTPAAVRFLSCEPLLGPVDLSRWLGEWCDCGSGPYPNDTSCRDCGDRTGLHCPHVGWVIVGGESGPDSRHFRTEWADSLVGQCNAAGVPVFVKQLGANVTTRLPDGEEWPNHASGTGPVQFSGDGFGHYHVRGLKDRKGGDMAEWPRGLRVREFPAAGRGFGTCYRGDMPMTATQPDLFSVWEATTDEEVAEYAGLTDGHLVAHCRCGRLVLTGLPGAKVGGSLAPVIAARGFKVADNDELPPSAFEWRTGGGGRRVAVCCSCAVAERRANRGRG